MFCAICTWPLQNVRHHQQCEETTVMMSESSLFYITEMTTGVSMLTASLLTALCLSEVTVRQLQLQFTTESNNQQHKLSNFLTKVSVSDWTQTSLICLFTHCQTHFILSGHKLRVRVTRTVLVSLHSLLWFSPNQSSVHSNMKIFCLYTLMMSDSLSLSVLSWSVFSKQQRWSLERGQNMCCLLVWVDWTFKAARSLGFLTLFWL